MQSQLFQCPGCLQDFNLTTNLPKVLPNCGHSVCVSCLSQLLANGNCECPHDKVKFPANFNTLETFATNYALRGMIDENKAYNFCSTHRNQKEEYFCLSEKIRVCSHCVIFGDHKGHEIKALEDLQSIADEKRKNLEIALDLLGSHSVDFDKIFEENRLSLLQMINHHYLKLSTLLEGQKQQLLIEVNTFFDQEKEKFQSKLGQGSVLKAEISRKMSSYQDFINSTYFTQTMEDDILDIEAKVDKALEEMNKYMKKVKEKSKDISESFEKIFMPLVDLGPKFEVKTKDFINKLNVIFFEISSKDGLGENNAKRFDPIELKCSLTFNILRNCLNIGKSEIKSKKVQLNLDKFRELKEISLELDRFSFEKNDLDALKIVWAALHKITKVQISGSNIQNIEESGIIAMLPIVFSFVQNLHEIEINFQWTKIGDEPLTLFAEKFLSKADNLQVLNINLNNTNVTDKTVQALGQKALPFLKKLKSLTLDFGLEPGSGAISAEAIEKIFVSMPTLQNFVIGLDGSNVADKCLETFVNSTLSSMKGIQSLQIGLWNTNVTDQSVTELLNKIGDMQKLIIDLRSTQITDKSINSFLRKFPMMTTLKEFELDISNTHVTKQVKAKLNSAKLHLFSS